MMNFFIDPHSLTYDNNKFFDLADANLNRDDGLKPFVKMKKDLEKLGFQVDTYDIGLKNPDRLRGASYLSFGRMRDFAELEKQGLRLMRFLILEPPLVDQKPYEALAYLTKHFEAVVLHNTKGDAYSLDGVNAEKLRKLFWPQPHAGVLSEYWNKTNRRNEVVMINGQHRPFGYKDRELYSKRIEWILQLNKWIDCRLYGRGWDRFVTRAALWPTFLLNYPRLKRIYDGPCVSKFAVMAEFDFALCFENLIMDGYITEKIFDCFYAGTIPIYWGGNDITDWIPADCFIDLRHFTSAQELAKFLKALSPERKSNYRNSAKAFLEGPKSELYFDLFKSLELTELQAPR